MNTRTIQVVAFDCDGVMFDSSQANRAYYDQILNAVRLPAMNAAQFAYAHMHTVHETLAFLIEDPLLLAAAHDHRRRLSYGPFIKYMVMEPQLRPLLTWLRPTYKTAVATNRTDTMARVLAEHGLQDGFDHVVTALDVRHPKPHPEPLLLLLAHFGVSPEQMIFVGDSELDAMAARQAGVPFVAYANTHLAADLHIAHLGQIRDLLEVKVSAS
jgi:phosphoglycolate phosphatase